jgi:predicted glutamine amidotransferase
LCRILLGYAEAGSLRLLARLVELHVKASEWDPLLARLNEEGDGRHCHGYGYAALIDRGWGWSLHYEKFDAADRLGEGEESCRANLNALREATSRLREALEDSRRALLLLHSRRASRGMPRGTLHAHPYAEPLHGPRGPGVLYVAHNGSVHHREIVSHLGLPVDPGRYTDTHILALLLARRVSGGSSLVEALEEGATYVKTAYVVGALLVEADGIEAAYSAVLPESLDEEKIEYYKPYILEAPGLKAVASPTTALLAMEEMPLLRAGRVSGTSLVFKAL